MPDADAPEHPPALKTVPCLMAVLIMVVLAQVHLLMRLQVWQLWLVRKGVRWSWEVLCFLAVMCQ